MRKIRELINRFRWRNRLFVILDARDSSCTFGKKLWKTIGKEGDVNLNRVFHNFKANNGCYGFCIDPKQWRDVEDECFSKVQVDTKTGHVGFSMVRPTASRVMWDYGLGIEYPVRVEVFPLDTKDNGTIWMMKNPIKDEEHK